MRAEGKAFGCRAVVYPSIHPVDLGLSEEDDSDWDIDD